MAPMIGAGQFTNSEKVVNSNLVFSGLLATIAAQCETARTVE
jgi:hypothetical protein